MDIQQHEENLKSLNMLNEIEIEVEQIYPEIYSNNIIIIEDFLFTNIIALSEAIEGTSPLHKAITVPVLSKPRRPARPAI
jgi:hypothetical protein